MELLSPTATEPLHPQDMELLRKPLTQLLPPTTDIDGHIDGHHQVTMDHREVGEIRRQRLRLITGLAVRDRRDFSDVTSTQLDICNTGTKGKVSPVDTASLLKYPYCAIDSQQPM